MTLAHFQTALAHLIRVHDGVRPDSLWDDFAALDLDEQEWASLEALAVDEELNAYGREQAEQRWDMVDRKLLRLRRSVDMELLYDYWQYDFEPQHPRLEADSSTLRGSYTLAFLDAILAQPPEFLDEGARLCLKDIISLERVEVQLSQHLCDDLCLLPDSPLAHRAWRLVALDYDILQWHTERADALAADAAAPLPAAKRSFFVVVRTLPGMSPRLFEVDEPMYAFLRGELGEGDRQPMAPEVKADLVALGLVQA